MKTLAKIRRWISEHSNLSVIFQFHFFRWRFQFVWAEKRYVIGIGPVRVSLLW